MGPIAIGPFCFYCIDKRDIQTINSKIPDFQVGTSFEADGITTSIASKNCITRICRTLDNDWSIFCTHDVIQDSSADVLEVVCKMMGSLLELFDVLEIAQVQRVAE